jgi:ketosteroid isomerase-like protein
MTTRSAPVSEKCGASAGLNGPIGSKLSKNIRKHGKDRSRGYCLPYRLRRPSPVFAHFAFERANSGGADMNKQTSEEARNEQVIRELYSLADASSKNTSRFVSLFTDDGYFYDVGAGKKYFGAEIGRTVDTYAAAFPDMHRELFSLRSFGDHVLVELSLNGTHKGDLVIPAGTISPTGKKINAPCCDVFRVKDGKVFSFHCYVAVPILLEQLGIYSNLQAAIRH